MTSPHTSADDGPLSIRIDGDLVAVAGELDAHTAPALAGTLAEHDGDVRLDMSGVDFVDSSGLRVLIESHQTFVERGSSLTIVDPSASVARLFELSAVDDYLNIQRS